VDRTVNRYGSVSLGGHMVLAAEILGGRRVSIRIDTHTLALFDPDSRELLRTRPNPLTPAAVARLHGSRPAGPPPQPTTEPVRIQRRVSATGTIMMARQTIALGRVHAGKTVTIDVTDTALTVACDDGPRTFRRATDHPVRWIKAHRPRKVHTAAGKPDEPDEQANSGLAEVCVVLASRRHEHVPITDLPLNDDAVLVARDEQSSQLAVGIGRDENGKLAKLSPEPVHEPRIDVVGAENVIRAPWPAVVGHGRGPSGAVRQDGRSCCCDCRTWR
jgi:hypothetical protein